MFIFGSNGLLFKNFKKLWNVGYEIYLSAKSVTVKLIENLLAKTMTIIERARINRLYRKSNHIQSAVGKVESDAG